jgi:hypothetical protein
MRADVLTPEQKAAGREFRARWRRLLDELDEAFPPASRCPPYTVWFRHGCKDRGSWALFMRQQYAPSPDGLFAFIYRHGNCSHCGLQVRSSGRLALAAENPPEKGAVIHMPLTNYELFLSIKQAIRVHPEWTDAEVAENLDLRQREKDLIKTARKDLEAG